MSKVITDLLAKAKKMEGAKVEGAVEALEFLLKDGSATVKNQEYLDLKAVVDRIESGEKESVTEKDKVVKGSESKDSVEGDKGEAKMKEEPDPKLKPKAKAKAKPEEKKRTDYSGIRQVGAHFYHESEPNESYATADECAKAQEEK